MKQLFKLSTLALSTSLLLIACGGGGSGSSNNTPTEQTGTFVDSPVQGIQVYINGKLTGTTDAKGQFKYMSGDTVTFKLGAVTLGSKKDPQTVTPADLTANQSQVSNMLVLLQSLDSDNNPENGISIPKAVVDNMVTAVDLSKTGTTLAKTKADLKTQITQWVDTKTAQTHFQNALSKQTPNDDVKSVTQGLVGYWQSNCQNGKKYVLNFEKLADTDNTIKQTDALRRSYAKTDCTGTYTDSKDTDISDWHKIQGVVKKGTETLVTLQSKTNDNTIELETVVFTANQFKRSNGEVYTKVNSFGFTDSGSTTPTTSDTQTIENAVNTLVGYWKSDCMTRTDGTSKRYFDQFTKINSSSFKMVKIIKASYGTANCSGARSLSLGSGQGEIHVFNGVADLPAFAGQDKFTATDDGVPETYNRMSQSEFEAVAKDVQNTDTSTAKNWLGGWNNEDWPLRMTTQLDSSGYITYMAFDFHKLQDSNEPCTWSQQNNASCFGVSDNFSSTTQSGALSTSGVTKSVTLKATSTRGWVFEGKVMGKTFSGTYTSPNNSGKFTAELF